MMMMMMMIMKMMMMMMMMMMVVMMMMMMKIMIAIPEELRSSPLKLYQFEEDISQKGLKLSFSWEQKNRNETSIPVGILMPYSLCYSEN